MNKSVVFDLKEIPVSPYEGRDKNIFFRGAGFKTRIIVLPTDGSMPECQMQTAVIFYVVSGEVEVTVDGEKHPLGEGHCLVGGPGRFSMKTTGGVRLLGVQIKVPQAIEKEPAL
jgi:mannose-6-phosphate isomerase-like protein (cupin superfamily)